MTVTNLKKLIAHYHGKVPADLVISGGPDLLLQALNNARKEAEQMHDFENAKVFADLVVDEVAGGSLDSAKLHGTATAVSIKTIETMGKFTDAPDSVFYPVAWVQAKTAHREQMNRANLGGVYSFDERYPDDGEWEACDLSRTKLVIYGRQVYLRNRGDAGTTQTIGIEGQRWLDEYVDATADNADFFLQHGYNYLLYAGVCELNYMTKEFANREEAFLPPPVREKQAALDALIRWDTFAYVGGTQR